MKRIVVIFVVVQCMCSCSSKSISYKKYESESLKIERVSDHVFQHISYLKTKTMGNVPCNGMIYFNGGEWLAFGGIDRVPGGGGGLARDDAVHGRRGYVSP